MVTKLMDNFVRSYLTDIPVVTDTVSSSSTACTAFQTGGNAFP
jgi:hypothetical protein